MAERAFAKVQGNETTRTAIQTTTPKTVCLSDRKPMNKRFDGLLKFVWSCRTSYTRCFFSYPKNTCYYPVRLFSACASILVNDCPRRVVILEFIPHFVIFVTAKEVCKFTKFTVKKKLKNRTAIGKFILKISIFCQ